MDRERQELWTVLEEVARDAYDRTIGIESSRRWAVDRCITKHNEGSMRSREGGRKPGRSREARPQALDDGGRLWHPPRDAVVGRPGQSSHDSLRCCGLHPGRSGDAGRAARAGECPPRSGLRLQRRPSALGGTWAGGCDLDRAERTGEPFEDALRAILETEAGRQLKELRDGPHGHERAGEWQENIRRERTEERYREQGRAE